MDHPSSQHEGNGANQKHPPRKSGRNGDALAPTEPDDPNHPVDDPSGLPDTVASINIPNTQSWFPDWGLQDSPNHDVEQPTRAPTTLLEDDQDGFSLAPDATTIRKFELGDYLILKMLGRGGMGIVYLARQRSANRIVALKCVTPELTGENGPRLSQSAVRRFHLEATAMAGLTHDHIVTVYDVGAFGTHPYYAMRYVDGRSLAVMLRGGPFDNQAAARLMVPIARAVEYAHQKEILHRDIKPSNILVDRDGRPLIADFGLAKSLANDSRMTQTGDRLGTPSYMSPEQVRGLSTIGPASDIYNLGATLYEMITGRPPFRAAEAIETLRQVLDEDPVAPRLLNRAVARDLETICLKCLEKKPEARYKTSGELADELERFLDGKPIQARPAGPAERAWKWVVRHPSTAGLVAVVFLAVLALGAIMAWAREQSAARRAESLVDTLGQVEVTRLPRRIRDFEGYRRWTDPILRRRLAQVSRDAPARLPLALALLPSDPSQSAYLEERILTANPAELTIIREALKPWAGKASKSLQRTLEAPREDKGRRLRAACALATLDPNSAAWRTHASEIVSWLVAMNRFTLAEWSSLLRPVQHWLRDDLASAFRRAENPGEADAAAFVFADTVDDPRPVIDLLHVAERDQSVVLQSKLAAFGRPALALLESDLAESLRSEGSDPAATTRKRANLALALLALGKPEPVWPLFRQRPVDDLRTTLIHRAAPSQVAPEIITDRLTRETDVSARRALLLTLGEYSNSQISPAERTELIPRIVSYFTDDPDPGVHSAAEWLLKRWGRQDEMMQRRQAMASADMPSDRDWYVNTKGHTLAIVRGPVEFVMGSGDGGPKFRRDDTRHRRLIGRSFAIATEETTIEQYQAFRPQYRRGQYHPSRTPAIELMIGHAMSYCRWLGEIEGLTEDQQCYPPETVLMTNGFLPYPDYLNRSGYRLPTEAEWEYSCRAGSTAERPFGDSPTYMFRYMWTMSADLEEPSPAGSLKPNDLGLFDMLGNGEEWCQDSFVIPYPTPPADGPVIDAPIVTHEGTRSVRGGAFNAPARNLRSGVRYGAHVTMTLYSGGFRIARTVR